jgi:hypothetical protein
MCESPSGGILASLKGALGLPESAVKTGYALLKDLFGKPLQVAGDMLADQIYWWQWENRIRIAHLAEGILAESEVARRVLPPGFLLPLLEACGDVDDASLQDLWAQLLASGVEDDRFQHPMNIDALRRMSGDDAHVLRLLARGKPRDIGYPEYDRALSRLYALGLSAGPQEPDYSVQKIMHIPHRRNLTTFGREFYRAVSGEDARWI